MGRQSRTGDDGIASFDRIRYRRHDADVFMWAFDLIELNGHDLRGDPLAVRKATLLNVVARAVPGIRFNEHLDEEDGPLVFDTPANSGSKASYRNGATHLIVRRSPHWIKSKNPNAAAVKREAEEDWGSKRRYYR
jgi:bifunctional non-homologous end joining protein LigD